MVVCQGFDFKAKTIVKDYFYQAFGELCMDDI